MNTPRATLTDTGRRRVHTLSTGVLVLLLAACTSPGAYIPMPTPMSVTTPTDALEIPAEAPVTFENPGSFKKLTDRELQRVVRGPDRFAGQGFELWACIWQFDAATGEGSFLAYISNQREDEYGWYSGENASFVGEPNALVDVVAGDIVKIDAVVIGPYEYPTTTGGSSVVPQFGVLKADRQKGSCD